MDFGVEARGDRPMPITLAPGLLDRVVAASEQSPEGGRGDIPTLRVLLRQPEEPRVGLVSDDELRDAPLSTVPATLPAQAQNCSGSCFDATFEYIASCTRTPARWAMGARSRKEVLDDCWLGRIPRERPAVLRKSCSRQPGVEARAAVVGVLRGIVGHAVRDRRHGALAAADADNVMAKSPRIASSRTHYESASA